MHVKRNFKKMINHDSNCFTLLILGDISQEATLSMLSILNKLDYMFYKNRIIFKSHPSNSIHTKNLNSDIELTNNPLDKLLIKTNIVITTVNSASAIEAYAAGIYVITILDNHNFNASPLREINDNQFVSALDELKEAIDKFLSCHKPVSNPDKIFWTDPDLPRWKNI